MSIVRSESASTLALLIPTYNPGVLLQEVLQRLHTELHAQDLDEVTVICVDDGCTDRTFDSDVLGAGVKNLVILRHPHNLGKGTALRTGLHWAASHGIAQVVTLDADGQHPASEAVRLLTHSASPDSLVLGVRDLRTAGAPRAAQASNAFSNWVLSLLGGETLLDTQCGLRRYPVATTLSLRAPSPGYAYESDLVLRAARSGVPIVHEPCQVIYPREDERVTFFDSVRDPTRIVGRVIATTFSLPHHRPLRRWGRRLLLTFLLGLVFYAIGT